MASRNAPKTCKQWGNYYNKDGKYGGGVKHGGKRLEVMTYQWGREKERFALDCDLLTNEGPWPRIRCRIVLACDRAVFCWNDLPRDAWFRRAGEI